jgi:hypothetical protein
MKPATLLYISEQFPVVVIMLVVIVHVIHHW